MNKEDGLESLLGQTVTLFCVNYIYAGKLMHVDRDIAMLENAHVVYDTGAFNTATYSNAQKLPHTWYIKLAAVESFGVLKSV